MPKAAIKIKTILLTVGMLMFSLSVLSLFFIDFNFGSIIIGGASCVLLVYGLFYEKLIKLKWLTYGIFAMAICSLAMMLFLGFYGQSDTASYDEDAVVVLGAGLRGEKVTRLLSFRLDKALEYAVKNPDAVIIVSGGQGPGEDITEGLAMERYLIDSGMDKDRIIKEDRATSTYENLLYSKEILDSLFDSPYKIAVITNDFHIFRAAGLAEKVGLNAAHCGAKTIWYSIPLNYSRECLAILKFFVLGK